MCFCIRKQHMPSKSIKVAIEVNINVSEKRPKVTEPNVSRTNESQPIQGLILITNYLYCNLKTIELIMMQNL